MRMSSRAAGPGRSGPTLPPRRETRSALCWVPLGNSVYEQEDSLCGACICQPLLNLAAGACQAARRHLDSSVSVGLVELWHSPGTWSKAHGIQWRTKKKKCPLISAVLDLSFLLFSFDDLSNADMHISLLKHTEHLVLISQFPWWQEKKYAGSWHWKILIILYIIIAFYLPTVDRNHNEKSQIFCFLASACP